MGLDHHFIEMVLGDVPPSQLSDWGFVPIPRVPETSPSRADVHGDSHRFASQWRLGAVGGHGIFSTHHLQLDHFLGVWMGMAL